MLNKEAINNLITQLKKYKPEQIYIYNSFNNPDIKIMLKKNNKDYVLNNDIDNIKTNADISLIPIEKLIENSIKRKEVIKDINQNATMIYLS